MTNREKERHSSPWENPDSPERLGHPTVVDRLRLAKKVDRRSFEEISDWTGFKKSRLESIFLKNVAIHPYELEGLYSFFDRYSLWLGAGVTHPPKYQFSPLQKITFGKILLENGLMKSFPYRKDTWQKKDLNTINKIILEYTKGAKEGYADCFQNPGIWLLKMFDEWAPRVETNQLVLSLFLPIEKDYDVVNWIENSQRRTYIDLDPDWRMDVKSIT